MAFGSEFEVEVFCDTGLICGGCEILHDATFSVFGPPR